MTTFCFKQATVTTFCFVVAFTASVIGIEFLIVGIVEEMEWRRIAIGAAVAVIAVFGWIGFFHFNHLDNTTWHRGDSVVYATMNTDDTFVITSQGILLRCEVASQCTGLVKGDHVIYQELNDGKVTLPDGQTRVHDIKDVVKG